MPRHVYVDTQFSLFSCCSTPLVVLGLVQKVNGVGVTQSMNVLFHSPAPMWVFSISFILFIYLIDVAFQWNVSLYYEHFYCTGWKSDEFEMRGLFRKDDPPSLVELQIYRLRTRTRVELSLLHSWTRCSLPILNSERIQTWTSDKDINLLWNTDNPHLYIYCSILDDALLLWTLVLINNLYVNYPFFWNQFRVFQEARPAFLYIVFFFRLSSGVESRYSCFFRFAGVQLST